MLSLEEVTFNKSDNLVEANKYYSSCSPDDACSPDYTCSPDDACGPDDSCSPDYSYCNPD